MKNNYSSIKNIFRLQCRLLNRSSSNNGSKMNLGELQVDQMCKRYYAPTISEESLKNINSIVGIQFGYSHVSWAKIEVPSNSLTCWNYLPLPKDMTKMDLHKIYSLALETINNLPVADYYIMENLPKMVVGTGGKTKLSLHATRVQFIAMIMAMINQIQNDERHQSVLFMKPLIVARLFKLLVGSEIVSSHDVVDRLLSNDDSKPFSSVKCSTEVLLDYNTAQKVEKEILGHALLLTITFSELVYYKNEACFKILSNVKTKT